jgi:hypothetical protein
MSVETIDRVRQAYQRSPTRRASHELSVPQSSVWKILEKKRLFKSSWCVQGNK